MTGERLPQARPPESPGSRPTPRTRIVCVDDNRLVLDGLVTFFRNEQWLEIVGLLSQADTLPDDAIRAAADIVLLDVDMPGRDPFDAMAELARRRPETRTIMLSGYVRADLVDRALGSGAWGYLCKGEDAGALIEAIQLVRSGEFALGPHVPADRMA